MKAQSLPPRHSPFKKATLPSPPQIAPPTGDQVFKCGRLLGVHPIQTTTKCSLCQQLDNKQTQKLAKNLPCWGGNPSPKANRVLTHAPDPTTAHTPLSHPSLPQLHPVPGLVFLNTLRCVYLAPCCSRSSP